MENKKLSYSEVVKLSPSQFDFKDNLLPSAILGLFQDIASVHGELIGVGFETMLENGLYWVTIRTKYDVLSQPKPYQQVVVETWPHRKGKVDFDRDYLVKDMLGNTLIKGTSKWCVISTTTRKLVFPTAVEYPQDFEYVTNVNYEDRFAKTESVQPKEKPDFTHKVLLSEIDHNQHLNNVHYAEYVFNALGVENLMHMQINYIAECKLGEEIYIYTNTTNDGFFVSGYVKGELKFSAFAK